MPVYSLEGTPGSGKTLYCVQKIIPDFLKIRDSRGELVPRHIYTNIEGLKPALICAFADIPYESIADYFHVLGQRIDEHGNTYEDKDYLRYWYYEPDSIEWVTEQNGSRQLERHPDWNKAKMIPYGSLIIIDEVQNYYSNRDFATIFSKRCIDFITKNRHYGWTLWWMSQNVDSVDVTFRRNTQYVYFLENMEIYGRPTTASVKMYEGWLIADKINTPPFAKQTFKYDNRYYQCYKSYVNGVATKEKRYKVNVFLQHKGFLVCVIGFVVLLIAAIIFNPIDVLTGKSRMKKTESSLTATAPTHHSFSGAVGAVAPLDTAVSRDSVEKECVASTFTSRGEVYVVLKDGKARKTRRGEKYEECR